MERLSGGDQKTELLKVRKFSLFQSYVARREMECKDLLSKGITVDRFLELSLQDRKIEYVNAMIGLRYFPKDNITKTLISVYKGLKLVDRKKIYRMYWNELLDLWNGLSPEQQEKYGDSTIGEMRFRTKVRERRRNHYKTIES